MKQQYRIRNWTEYHVGLVQRGSLAFWVSEDVLEVWVSTDFTEDPGAPMLYSDMAIETVVTLNSLLHLGGRQASGFIASGKRRAWLKLHLAGDEATGDILAAVVSTNNVADLQVLLDLRLAD